MQLIPALYLSTKHFHVFFYFCFLNEICSTLNLIASVKCTHYLCWSSDLQFFALAVHISKIYLSIVFLNYKLCLIGCWAGWVLPTGFPTLHGVMLHWLPPPDAIINQLSVKFEKLWKKSCEQATVANYVILQPAGFSQNESCILFRDHGYS